MKKFLKIIGVLLAVVVIVVGGAFYFIQSGMAKSKDVALSGVTADGLKDGAYEGHYQGGRFSNTIRVTVKGEAITAIHVLKPAAIEPEGMRDAFIEKVIASQTTDIDAVAGATLTTNAYLKSVETALSTK